jgi:hypothetical protein
MSLLSEVDGIVRSLEDEKANEDERERTRDTLARIEGLERDPVSHLCFELLTLKLAKTELGGAYRHCRFLDQRGCLSVKPQ